MDLVAENSPLYVVGTSEVKVCAGTSPILLKGDYQLRVYLPAPHHPTHAFHTLYSPHKVQRLLDNRGTGRALYDAPKQRTGKSLSLLLPRTDIPIDTPVSFQLFLYRDNEDGQVCQYLAASGVSTLEELLRAKSLASTVRTESRIGLFGKILPPVGAAMSGISVALNNEDGEKVATLQLSRLNLESPCHTGEATGERIPAQIWQRLGPEPDYNDLDGYTPLNNNVLSHMRVYVPSPFGFRVPFWMYAAGPIEPLCNRTPEAYWLNAILLALRTLRYPEKLFTATPWLYPEVLAQVVGQFTWLCPYLPDEKIDLMTKQKQGYEQFSYNRLLPDETHMAGDCEDGARDALLCFRALRAHAVTTETSPLVRALVFLSRFYAGCTVDATISLMSHGKPRDVLHMYVKLIPWEIFYRFYTRPSDLPTPTYISDVGAVSTFTCVALEESEDVPIFAWSNDLASTPPELPILQIESTDRSLGDWSNQSYSALMDDMITKLKPILSEAGTLMEEMGGRVGFHNTRKLFQEAETPFYIHDLSLSGYDVYRVLHQGAVLLSAQLHKYGVPPFAGRELPPGHFALVPYLSVSRQEEKLLSWLHDQLPRVRPLCLDSADVLNVKFPKGTWIPLFLRPDRAKKHQDTTAKLLQVLKNSDQMEVVHCSSVAITARSSIELVLVQARQK